jgi:hypothetical protein
MMSSTIYNPLQRLTIKSHFQNGHIAASHSSTSIAMTFYFHSINLTTWIQEDRKVMNGHHFASLILPLVSTLTLNLYTLLRNVQKVCSTRMKNSETMIQVPMSQIVLDRMKHVLVLPAVPQDKKARNVDQLDPGDQTGNGSVDETCKDTTLTSPRREGGYKHGLTLPSNPQYFSTIPATQ